MRCRRPSSEPACEFALDCVIQPSARPLAIAPPPTFSAPWGCCDVGRRCHQPRGKSHRLATTFVRYVVATQLKVYHYGVGTKVKFSKSLCSVTVKRGRIVPGGWATSRVARRRSGPSSPNFVAKRIGLVVAHLERRPAPKKCRFIEIAPPHGAVRGRVLEGVGESGRCL